LILMMSACENVNLAPPWRKWVSRDGQNVNAYPRPSSLTAPPPGPPVVSCARNENWCVWELENLWQHPPGRELAPPWIKSKLRPWKLVYIQISMKFLLIAFKICWISEARIFWPRAWPRGSWPRPRGSWPRPRGSWPRPRGSWPR